MSLRAVAKQQPLRVLFVAYAFPPDAEVGAKRVARLCRYLPEHGIRPVVLTAEEQFYESTDPSYTIPEELEICRVPVRSGVLDWYRALKAQRQTPRTTGRKAPPEQLRTRRDRLRPAREYVSTLLKPPNHQPGWYGPAVEAGMRLLRTSDDFAAIISSGPPWTCHAVARALKRRSGLPWIADFRDAWTFNPWRPNLPTWRWKLEERLERSIVTEADRVISVVDLISEDFRTTYANLPSDKFLTITNGFETPECSNAGLSRDDGRRTFLHLGSLAFDRKIENFCRAVRKLVDRQLISIEKTKIVFVGSISSACWQRAHNETPELFESGLIEFRDRVPYEEGQRMLASADVLLIVLGDNRHVVTAKFYEYIATPKPLMVVARDGALTRLVEELGVGVCADPDSPDDIARQLLRAMDLPHRTEEKLSRIAQRFHYRNLAGQTAEVIRQLVVDGRTLGASMPGSK